MDNTINKRFDKFYYIKRVVTPAMQKQEIWRQKQIKQYYLVGRPLFGKYEQKFYF